MNQYKPDIQKLAKDYTQLDVNFENATPYYGDGYYFEFGDDPEGIGYMEGRNVWRINITDLGNSVVTLDGIYDSKYFIDN